MYEICNFVMLLILLLLRDKLQLCTCIEEIDGKRQRRDKCNRGDGRQEMEGYKTDMADKVVKIRMTKYCPPLPVLKSSVE
jgi:hypothetical protein